MKMSSVRIWRCLMITHTSTGEFTETAEEIATKATEVACIVVAAVATAWASFRSTSVHASPS
ncbi:unnamed protein product [Moneuplotes crassus]|uniref:Uncharacterized protein n=1 Tax=Euplotes crassus TaxID=5936 RepID=A0AAD1XQV7_EUPCR|nr:unnamed protein product [Moneuplotes crassus]